MIFLFIPPAFGKSEAPSRHHFFQLFDKFFGDEATKRKSCPDERGRCLFLHDSEGGDLSDEDKLQQCALDLCGPPDPNFSWESYLHSDPDIERFVRTDQMKEYVDEFRELEIRELIEEWADRNMASRNRLQRIFQKRSDQLKSEPDHLEPTDYEYLSRTFFSKYVQKSIDRRRPVFDRLSIQIDVPEGTSEQLTEGINSFAQDLKNDINSSFVQQIRHNVYDSQEAEAVLREKWRDFIRRYEDRKKINEYFPDHMEEDINDMREAMKQLEDRGKTTNSATAEMNNSSEKVPVNSTNPLIEAAELLEGLEENFTGFTTGLQPENEKQPLCQQKACREAVKEATEELFARYEKPTLKQEQVNHYSAQCLSQFILLKELDKVTERLGMTDLKRTFLNRVFKNFSIQTKQSFEDYINGFYIGRAGPNFQDIKDAFINVLKDREPSSDNKTEEEDNIELITTMYRMEMNWKEGWHSPCEFFIPMFFKVDIFSPPAPQATENSSNQMTSWVQEEMLSKGLIGLSSFSCLHPHHGRGIASHEMGHLLSWMFSQNKLSDKSYSAYKKLRECATKRYKNLNAPSEQPKFSHEGDQWNTEEDTADLISYLTFPNSRTLYSCALLSITEDGTKYDSPNILDDNWKRTTPDSHYYSPPKPSRSSTLLRVLFEAIHKRIELSSACQQVVDQYKDEINFEPCF